MAFLFHGIGMTVYGERDYWPDGSFVTTEWFVFAYLPIAPIISKRISYTQNSPYSTYDAGGFYVYEIRPLNLKQVISTYLWFASFLVCTLGWIYFQDVIERRIGDTDTAAGMWIAVLLTLILLPYALRRMAKRRKVQQWRRMNAGLEPYSSDE